MADRKITDLTALAAGGQATGDLLTIVDVSEAAATDKNKKITVESLFKGIPGDVGIGTSSPAAPLDLHKGSTGDLLRFGFDGTTYADFAYASNTFTLAANNSKSLAFETGSSERLRIDSSGRLLLGASSSVAPNRSFQIAGSANMSICSNVNSADGVTVDYIKSRNTTYGSNTIVQSGDTIAKIQFRADDGGDYLTQAAQIAAQVDGTPGANDMPGRLVFYTTADNANSPTERMRIDSSGVVNIGTTAAADTDVKLQVSFTGGNSYIQIKSADSTGTSGIKFGRNSVANRAGIDWSASTDALQFRTGGTNERMRIDSSGNVGIGTTSPTSKFDVEVASNAGVNFTNVSTAPIIDFKANSVESAGRIRVNEASGGGVMQFATKATGGTITEAMRIDSSGNIGIGTTSPTDHNSFTRIVDVSGSGGGAIYCRTGTSSSNVGIFGQSGSDVYVINKASGNIRFNVADAEKMRIDSSGRVGIGTSSPSAALDVVNTTEPQVVVANSNSNGANMRFQNTTTGSGQTNGLFVGIDASERGVIYNYENTDLYFGTNSTERMRIDSNGRLRVPGRGINVAANSDISFSDYGFTGGGDTDGVLARHSGNAYFSVDDYFRIRDNNNNNENKKFEFNTDSGSAGADANWNSNNFDFAEMFEWSDGNPNAEDRIGYSVAVDGLTGKIKIAEEGDVPIGIVSGTASFVANAGEIQWAGRSKRDEWGRLVYEPAVTVDDEGNEVPLLDDEGNQRTKAAVNPDWDEARYASYVPRSQRPEWACIGVVGQVYMRKGCPVDARWIKLKEVDSVKDLWLIR